MRPPAGVHPLFCDAGRETSFESNLDVGESSSVAAAILYTPEVKNLIITPSPPTGIQPARSLSHWRIVAGLQRWGQGVLDINHRALSQEGLQKGPKVEEPPRSFGLMPPLWPRSSTKLAPPISLPLASVRWEPGVELFGGVHGAAPLPPSPAQGLS